MIEEYFSSEKSQDVFDLFLQKIIIKNRNVLFFALIDLYHYIPLKTKSFCIKKIMETFFVGSEESEGRDHEVYL